MEYLILIRMLKYCERAHLYLINTWFSRNNSIHFKLRLPCEIAWSFHLEMAHFYIYILASLSLTLNVKCYTVILYSFRFHIKISCFKIKYTPLTVFFLLSINCNINVLIWILYWFLIFFRNLIFLFYRFFSFLFINAW